MRSKEKLNIGASAEERAKFIAENESSIYGGINEDGDRVDVHLAKGIGMDVKTFQTNGWLRVDEYGKDGSYWGTTFEGRWTV